jgi:hypothetical protein
VDGRGGGLVVEVVVMASAAAADALAAAAATAVTALLTGTEDDMDGFPRMEALKASRSTIAASMVANIRVSLAIASAPAAASGGVSDGRGFCADVGNEEGE